MSQPDPTQPFVWCVVADVIPGSAGAASRFAPGEPVYCFPPLWSNWGERLRVLGRASNGGRVVSAVVPTKRLTGWRVERVADADVIRMFWDSWDATEESRLRAERMAQSLSEEEPRE